MLPATPGQCGQASSLQNLRSTASRTTNDSSGDSHLKVQAKSSVEYGSNPAHQAVLQYSSRGRRMLEKAVDAGKRAFDRDGQGQQ